MRTKSNGETEPIESILDFKSKKGVNKYLYTVNNKDWEKIWHMVRKLQIRVAEIKIEKLQAKRIEKQRLVAEYNFKHRAEIAAEKFGF